MIDKTNDVSIMITNFVSILMRGEIMPRTGLTKEEIIEKAAALANEKGLSYLTVTTLSEYLGIRKPSLYNHIKTIDDLYYKLMIYGWKKVSEEIAVGINSSDPNENLKTFGRSFYLLFQLCCTWRYSRCSGMPALVSPTEITQKVLL